MNSVILKKTRLSQAARLAYWCFSFLFLVTFLSPQLLAEGSKDFIGNDGYRLFLDTRVDQQMKVYAQEGEFINVGSSHIGIQGGYIDVFRPNGTLHTRYDGSSANPNEAIIFNNTQEANGPIGGTSGYTPGAINVTATEEGIWTVVFNYPTDSEASYSNILNSAPWTRAANQPNFPVVILAWDITVSQNSAADNGGNMLTGRVYSNRYVSEVIGNNNQTSPTFYILSKDGFTYKVDFQNIDPFRFTVGSNSFGIIDGDLTPTYSSVAVGDYTLSGEPQTWQSDSLYFYQLMSEDYQALINNKVFFNPPANDLPLSATVTDLFATTPNTHTTWLLNPATFDPSITFSGFNYVGLNDEGIECDPNTAQTGIGGFVVFDTNLGGTTTLQLDLNGDGDFVDDVDRNIFTFVEAGTDSIFWDGNDGFGNQLPIGEGFTINYNISIRGGEIHIPLIDIENNTGGVNFSILNENGVPVQSNIYFDHTNVGGTVSGGGTAGNPLPTTDLYTWDNSFGDNIIFDFWTYIPFTGDGAGTFTINISDNCICQEATTPVVNLTSSNPQYCENEGDVILSANNSTPNLDTLYYTYSNTSGLILRDTVIGNAVSSVNLGNAVASLADIYSVNIISDRGCVSTTETINLTINANPDLGIPITDLPLYCQGDAITITTPISNINGTYNYVLQAPNGDTEVIENTQSGNPIVLTNAVLSQSGQYSLIVSTPTQCVDTATVDISINPFPQITEFNSSNGNTNCEGDSIAINIQADLSGTYLLTLPGNNINGGDLVAGETLVLPISSLSTSQGGTYTVSTTSEAGCSSPETSIDINVNTYPNISMTGIDTYCEGNEITLTAANNIAGTGDLTYIWTKDDVILQETVVENATSTLTISNFTEADAGTYQLAVSSQCGIEPISFELEYLANLVYSNVLGGGSYCQFETVFLSAETNQSNTDTVSYTWTGPNDYIFTSEAPFSGPFPSTIPSLDQSGQYILTIESQNFTCQSSSLEVDLAVNASPVIGDIQGVGDYCENTPIQLSALNSNPLVDSIDFVWTAPNGTEFTGVAAGNEPLAYTTNGAQNDWSGTWTLTVATENGCTTDTAMVDVSVSPAHVIFGLGDEGGTFCEGETISFDAWNGNPAVETVTWSWQNDNGIFATGTSNTTDVFNATIENISIEDTGLYVLLLNSPGSACPEGVGTFEIFIEETPIVADITGGGTVCEGDEVTLTGTNTAQFTGNLDYTWTGPNGFMQTGTGSSNDEFSISIPNITAENAGEYVLNFVTQNGCMAEATNFTTIGLFSDISPVIGASTDLACNGEEVIFSTSQEGDSFNWYFNDGTGATLLTTTTSPSLSINPFNFENAGSYSVEIEAECGISPPSGTVNVNTISGVDAFEDSSITEQDVAVGISVMTNDLMGNNTGIITTIITAPENGTAVFNADNTVTYTPNAGFSGADTFVYEICSDVCTETCDQALVSITINPEINEECFIPNYFTPNGDASNQTFYIDCLETVYPDNNITIYNRWGDEIYKAEPYLNDWIGQYNDSDLPAGTYFYILNLTPDGSNCQQGYITIVK